MDISDKPIIHNWVQYGTRVFGYLYNDSRAKNGEQIMTSNIKNIDREAMTLETMNTSYDLGKEVE